MGKQSHDLSLVHAEFCMRKVISHTFQYQANGDVPAGWGSHFCDWIDYKGVAFSIEFVSSKSNQHQFSPNGYENFFTLFTVGHGFQSGDVCGYRGLSTLLPVLIISLTDRVEFYPTLKKLVHFLYLVVLNLNKVSQLFAHLYLTLCFKYV